MREPSEKRAIEEIMSDSPLKSGLSTSRFTVPTISVAGSRSPKRTV